MKSQFTESEVTSVQGGIRLVLNGGKVVMEQATIPIQWFFSPEIINKRPTHVLIIEQDSTEYGTSYAGARYVRPITDRIAFVQLFKPGKHRIAVIAMTCDLSEFFLKEDNIRIYSKRCYFSDIAEAIETGEFGLVLGNDLNKNVLVGATIQEIEVPEELFAPRSKSKIGEIVWKWVNRWHSKEPRDQCQYRKRLLFAFTLQPILFALGMVARFIGQMVLTVLIPLIRLVILFFGFRPNSPFEHTRVIWRSLKDVGEMKASELFLHDSVRGFRVWNVEGSKVAYMPVTGFELVLLGLIVYAVKFAFITMATLEIIGAGLLIAGVLTLIICRSKPAPNEEELQKYRAEKYEEWLRNLAIDQAPKKVNLNHLPVSYRGGLTQKFFVGFWNLKMKVCRPYSK